MNETATDKVPTPEDPSEPTEPQAAETPAAPRAESADPPTPVSPAAEPSPPAEPTPPSATPPASSPVPPALPSVPPSPPPRPSTRLVRSRSDRMIGGVCGGLAKVLNIDPLILRLALVLATVLGFGAGVVLYVACWILMPEDDR